ncbi:hypothetical protein, partial [Brucella ceti]|uniref:hypothetical protein n=1 Tax=Brucella ceti TaxID=120577 RepID=UPI0035D49495
ALAVLTPFTGGEIPAADFERTVREAYGTFRHDAVCPLVLPHAYLHISFRQAFIPERLPIQSCVNAIGRPQKSRNYLKHPQWMGCSRRQKTGKRHRATHFAVV